MDLVVDPKVPAKEQLWFMYGSFSFHKVLSMPRAQKWFETVSSKEGQNFLKEMYLN